MTPSRTKLHGQLTNQSKCSISRHNKNHMATEFTITTKKHDTMLTKHYWFIMNGLQNLSQICYTNSLMSCSHLTSASAFVSMLPFDVQTHSLHFCLCCQRWIQDFPGGTNSPGFCQILPKTAWNRKNLGAQGGACPSRPSPPKICHWLPLMQC